MDVFAYASVAVNYQRRTQQLASVWKALREEACLRSIDAHSTARAQILSLCRLVGVRERCSVRYAVGELGHSGDCVRFYCAG